MSDLDNVLFDLAYQEGKSVSECLYDIYEKGRADGIDDCIKLVGGNVKTIVGIVFDNTIPLNDRAYARSIKNDFIEELVEQLEQLKEGKNESI